MQAVNQLQQHNRVEQVPASRSWWQIPDRLASLLTRVLQQGQQQAVCEHVFTLETVAYYQWLYPVVLGVALWFVSYLARVY